MRGAFPLALRAVYALPPELAAQGLTVSDVKIGGTPIQFGGQLAERITMHIAGLASVAKDIHNAPVTVCGAVPQVDSARSGSDVSRGWPCTVGTPRRSRVSRARHTPSKSPRSPKPQRKPKPPQKPKPSQKVRPQRAALRPAQDEGLLEVDDIQGNILGAFNKDHQLLVALAIHDVAAAKSSAQPRRAFHQQRG